MKRSTRIFRSAAGLVLAALIGSTAAMVPAGTALAWAPTGGQYLTASSQVRDYDGQYARLNSPDLLMMLVPVHSGWCLTAGGHGRAVEQRACTGLPDQQFAIVASNVYNGYQSFKIVDHSPAINECIGVSGSSQANGVSAVSWNCSAPVNDQRFFLEQINGYGSTAFRLRPAHSGKCLGISAGRRDVAPLIQWTCGSPATSIPDQIFIIGFL
jgi:hypothetical protein